MLVRDVHPLAGQPHAVALDRLGQDQGRLARVFDRRLESAVDLEDVMAAAIERPDVGIGIVGDQFLEFRRIEEMFANISSVPGLEGLVLAVNQFHHALLKQSFLVALEQHIPVATPDQLDDIPPGTAEGAFEFLDDLAVAAHRPVKTLQVAVNDEDQVIEILARGHADSTERFDFVGLAIAEEGPDLAILGFDEATALHVLHETCLVNGLDRTETHRYRRELPEIRHQPGVRVGG